MMKIKVCGLKDPENIKAVAALLPDYMGFIFYGPSARFVGEIAFDTLKLIPASIKKTAVFVNSNANNINTIIDKYNFDAIQLHGNEGPETGALFKGKVEVIKAFGISEDFDFEQLYAYVEHVDYFLFDTKTSSHGGSGKAFDWGILNNYKLDIPFFLSGGLSSENLEDIKDFDHPQFYGIDLNSRFETKPGVKNIEKLETAFKLFKQNDTNEIRS